MHVTGMGHLWIFRLEVEEIRGEFMLFKDDTPEEGVSMECTEEQDDEDSES